MPLQNRIDAWVTLRQLMHDFAHYSSENQQEIASKSTWHKRYAQIIENLDQNNTWFTADQMQYANTHWSKILTKNQLRQFFSSYEIRETSPKKIGIIMAGNIPFVGMHDLLCVHIFGHQPVVKMSSSDEILMQFVIDFINHHVDAINVKIVVEKEKLTDISAVIATGSNNTAKYFEYYFRHIPHIIRKNRNSVAVLSGKETLTDLIALGDDIFRYYGLGCRSVSKLYVPVNYDFTLFFEAMYQYKDVIFFQKYANNYDYNKAVFLMSNFKLLDNEFLLLKEDASLASPIATVFYEYYSDLASLQNHLECQAEHIQCIVSNADTLKNGIAFGTTQVPALNDFADNVDTIKFLQTLN